MICVRDLRKQNGFCPFKGWIGPLVCCAIFFGLLGDGLATMQASRNQDDRPQWKTGAEREQKLASAVSITFTGVPLREELSKFSRQQGIGLFIDRRVDPSISISMNEANLTFEQALWKLAENNRLGVCQLGEIYYLGPPEVAKMLPVLWFEMKSETNQLGREKSEWSKRSAVNWPALNQPAETLTLIAQTHQLKIHSKENGAAENKSSNPLLPHDVWPEVRLPAIALDEQVALLLVGFGLWFERNDDGSEVSFIDFPTVQEGQIAWVAPLDIRKKLPMLREKFSGAKFSTKGKTLLAKGTVADLLEIAKWLVAARDPLKGTINTYSLKTHATRQQILETICQRIGRRLEFAPELARTMDERIEFSVEDVELEELIRKVLEDTDLNYDLDSERLTIQN